MTGRLPLAFAAVLAIGLLLLPPCGIQAQTQPVAGPAAPGEAVRTTSLRHHIDLSFAALTDFGSGSQGFGSAASLSYALRTRGGVWGLGIRLGSTPQTMTRLPLGEYADLRLTYSKTLSRTFAFSVGISGGLAGKSVPGDEDRFTDDPPESWMNVADKEPEPDPEPEPEPIPGRWGAGLDVGFLHRPGDVFIFKDLRWGARLSGIGIDYGVRAPHPGNLRGSALFDIPVLPTLSVGAGANLLRTDTWRIGIGAGLATPAFADLDISASLRFGFRNLLALDVLWDAGLLDLISGGASGRSFLPSLRLSFSMPFGAPGGMGTVGTHTGAEPLYGPLVAAGGGVFLSVGGSPRIDLRVPVSPGSVFYLSPNGDGINDELVIPVGAAGGAEVGAWKFHVENRSAGSTVFARSASSDHSPIPGAFRSPGDGLDLCFGRVPLPESLVWDGRDDGGKPVPDGAYSVGFVSVDESGTLDERYRNCMIVVVDNDAPAASLATADRRKVLSPDGDGRFDTLGLRLSGSVERRWNLDLLGPAGTARPIGEWFDQSPPDLEWDGRDLSGNLVPDGTYDIRLYTTDHAERNVERRLLGIVVDTRAPDLLVEADAQALSPNGDGVMDWLHVSVVPATVEGLERIVVAADGPLGKESWTAELPGPSGVGQDIRFTGFSSDGVRLPDGAYRFRAVAEYGHGYRIETEGPRFLIDSVFPEATVKPGFSDPVFSPDGDGVRDAFPFIITGSHEALWTMVVRDAAGQTVLERRFRNSRPESFLWDGRNDAGKRVPDGTYLLLLSSVDGAGNAVEVRSGPVVVDTRRPGLRLTVSPGAFSPNGDGVHDLVTVTIRPDTREEIVAWSFSTSDARGTTVSVMEGQGGASLPDTIVLDGKDAPGGNRWPDGTYRSMALVRYRSGHAASAVSPDFVLDTKAPSGKISIERAAFNPAAKPGTNHVRILQEGSQEDVWIGRVDRAGFAVRTWTFRGALPAVLEWDGTDDSGKPVPDGLYGYRIASTDRAGNRFESKPLALIVESSEKTARITAEPRVFSPNGDGVKDTLAITVDVSSGAWISGFRLSVAPAGVVPASQAGAEVRTWQGTSAPGSQYEWDGRDDAGRKVSDGAYTLFLRVEYLNGDVCEAAPVSVVVDAEKPRVYVAVAERAISPNGDGIKDEALFTLVVERMADVSAWSFTLLSSDRARRVFSGGLGGSVPGRLIWDGRDESGEVVRGAVQGKLVVVYEKGDVAEATSEVLLVDDELPRVEVKIEPEYFSPDGDGVDDTVSIRIVVVDPSRLSEWRLDLLESAPDATMVDESRTGGRVFRSWSGSGAPPDRIVWDGRSTEGELAESATDYPFRLVVRDIYGNSLGIDGVIAVDVLVIRDGDRLRVKVPSIVFQADQANLDALPPGVVKNNIRVVDRIVRILGRFPDYSIRIEGHANNLGKMTGRSAQQIRAEEQNEIVPLSLSRAEKIRDLLVERGFDRRRLTVRGLGSGVPVVDPSDRVNRWKNRRVEFILVRE